MTIYLGAIYEKNLNTSEVTTYYFAGAQRVAMRKGGNLYYFVADHLGSTSVTLDASGNKIDEMKYYPFGETRSGSAPTDRRFTGQRQEDSSLGSLYDFNARMYSPSLGRFISPDTIVPDGKNPQAFNRYAYTLNNPVKYNDPTGHDVGCPGESAEQCGSKPPEKKQPVPLPTPQPTPHEPSKGPWSYPAGIVLGEYGHGDLYLSTSSTLLTVYQLSAGQHFRFSQALVRDFAPSNPASEGVKISAGMLSDEILSEALSKINVAIPVPNPIDLYEAYYEARDSTMAAVWEIMAQAQAATMSTNRFVFEPANILLFSDVGYRGIKVDLVVFNINGHAPTSLGVSINPAWRDHLELVIMNTQLTYPTD